MERIVIEGACYYVLNIKRLRDVLIQVLKIGKCCSYSFQQIVWRRWGIQEITFLGNLPNLQKIWFFEISESIGDILQYEIPDKTEHRTTRRKFMTQGPKAYIGRTLFTRCCLSSVWSHLAHFENF